MPHMQRYLHRYYATTTCSGISTATTLLRYHMQRYLHRYYDMQRLLHRF